MHWHEQRVFYWPISQVFIRIMSKSQCPSLTFFQIVIFYLSFSVIKLQKYQCIITSFIVISVLNIQGEYRVINGIIAEVLPAVHGSLVIVLMTLSLVMLFWPLSGKQHWRKYSYWCRHPKSESVYAGPKEVNELSGIPRQFTRHLFRYNF